MTMEGQKNKDWDIDETRELVSESINKSEGIQSFAGRDFTKDDIIINFERTEPSSGEKHDFYFGEDTLEIDVEAPMLRPAIKDIMAVLVSDLANDWRINPMRTMVFAGIIPLIGVAAFFILSLFFASSGIIIGLYLSPIVFGVYSLLNLMHVNKINARDERDVFKDIIKKMEPLPVFTHEDAVQYANKNHKISWWRKTPYLIMPILGMAFLIWVALNASSFDLLFIG